MKLIFKARDISEAHIVAGLLEARNIEAHVGGHYLQGGIGELAAMEFATVYVADESAADAKLIIREYESSNKYQPEAPAKKSNPFILPLIIITICVLMILGLAMIFNSY